MVDQTLTRLAQKNNGENLTWTEWESPMKLPTKIFLKTESRA